MKKIYVINARGEREPFSFKKVYNSARRVGASPSFAKEIAKRIESEIFPNIKTSQIYSKVKKMLSKKKKGLSIKFSLKEAMKRLGPTGFPFEKYVGSILLKKGFKIKLNQIVSGHCCSYEIDFLAEKKNLFYIGECKYRNISGGRVHSDTALSNYARFLDIQRNKTFKNKKGVKSILVTNAKFTSKAIKYSKCMGVDLLGWNYPRKESLESIIDKEKLYPITILRSLRKDVAETFVSKRIMLVKDLMGLDLEKFAKKNNLSLSYLNSLLKDAKLLIEK
jgi:hypothetical protein